MSEFYKGNGIIKNKQVLMWVIDKKVNHLKIVSDRFIELDPDELEYLIHHLNDCLDILEGRKDCKEECYDIGKDTI